MQQAAKILTIIVSGDVPTVPQKPSDDCPPVDTLEKPVREMIAKLESLFAERPAWTRRAIRNRLNTDTPEQRFALRRAVPYVAYIFRAGPWRDAIIRFGYDPRKTKESHKVPNAHVQDPPAGA